MSQISIQLRIAQRQIRAGVQDVLCRGRIGQFCRAAARLVVECGQIVRQFSAELVNARHDQLEMRAIFQARILTDLFVIFVTARCIRRMV